MTITELMEEQAKHLVTEQQVREEILQLPPLGFLGIDVGIRRRTSWALVSKAGELIAVGDVAVDAKMKESRYGQLAIDLYKDLPWDDVEVVGVERPYFNKHNPHSVRTLALATGVIHALSALFGKELLVLDGKQVKTALTGDYLATTQKMRLEAELKYGREFHADQASAIGIALAVWERRR